MPKFSIVYLKKQNERCLGGNGAQLSSSHVYTISFSTLYINLTNYEYSAYVSKHGSLLLNIAKLIAAFSFVIS